MEHSPQDFPTGKLTDHGAEDEIALKLLSLLERFVKSQEEMSNALALIAHSAERIADRGRLDNPIQNAP